MDHATALDPDRTRRRKRSAVACTKCHQRKVRCDVAQTRVPCSNCVHDGVVCKATLPNEKLLSLPRLLPRGSANSLSHAQRVPSPPDAQKSNASTADGPLSETGRHSSLSGGKPIDSGSRSYSQQADVLRQDPVKGIVRYRATEDFSPDEDDCEQIPVSQSMILYAGDEEGLEFVFETCFPDRTVKSNHYIIPRPPPQAEFAHDSGLRDPVLTSFPAKVVLQELFRCYFQHVHPFLPIVDANDFLSDSNSPRKRSPLLKWSMLFAATSFISSQGLEKSGYTSRKAMKRAMYRQAKRLYDVEVEADRVVMIQSAVLLSYWYADLEDRCGSWQWLAAAISVCQTIGMHRNPQGSPGARHLYPHYQSWLWRRIFWTCYFRDVWLCLALGRPMRINLDDCDTPMPALGDLLEDIAGSLDASGGKLLYDDCLALARYWLNLLKLTILLGGILANIYRPASKPTVHDIEKTELDILSNSQEAQNYFRQSNPLLTLHWCHLKAYYNSVIIALHRPFLLKFPIDLPRWRQEDFYTTTLHKVKTAASSTTAILRELISLNLISVCASTMVVLMMSPGQIHLHETKSPDRLTRQYATNQLDVHMAVLRELQKTHWSANMQYELFSRARLATKALPPTSSGGPNQPISTSGMPMGVLAGESLPMNYNNITGTLWSAYLEAPVNFNLASHEQDHVANPSFDFFSPAPSMPTASTNDSTEYASDRRDEPYR